MNSLSRLLPLVLALSLGSAAVAEDARVGGARALGLAGTGIALPRDAFETHVLNPAILGFTPKRFGSGLPWLGYHTKNITLGQIQDLVSDTTNGGVSDDTALKIARKYASKTDELGLNGGFGVSFDNFALSGRFEADVRAVPNATLADFLKTHDHIDDNTEVPLNARLDAYGLGYYEADASFGHLLPFKGMKDKVSVGATVRAITAYYAHKIADAESINSDNSDTVRNGTEFANDDDDVIRRSSLGMDLGAMASFHSLPDAYFGFNVKNLVEPNIHFVRTSPDTDSPLIDDVRPFRREIGVGASYVKPKYLVAADLIDLGNHADHTGFRAGAEYSPTRWFSIRGGFDSRSGFAAGIGIFGINVAYTADNKTALLASLRF